MSNLREKKLNEMMHLQPCLDPVERECLPERHFAEQHRSRALS